MTPKEIQSKIAALHGQIKDDIDHFGASGLTAPIVLQKHAQILDLTAQLAEITTRRIVWLTVFLLFFTIALFAVEVRTIFFPQNPSAYPHTEHVDQQQQVVIPAVTNR